MSGLQTSIAASDQSLRHASTQTAQVADPPAVSLLAQFRQTGWLPAQTLADKQTLSHLRSLDFENASVTQANARKALWQADLCTRNLAMSPALTDILDVLFEGAGYYLWGSRVIDRDPAQSHDWHSDIETAGEGFVSVWIGIEGTNADTSLHVIDRSHRNSGPVQAFWPFGHAARSDPAAREILAHPDLAGITGTSVAACLDGQGIFFDGRLWHGSFNQSGQPRRALLLQYGRHGVPVRHTSSFKAYPFQYHPSDNPITLPIKGEPDPVANKTVIRRPDGSLGYPVAKVGARPTIAQNDKRPLVTYPGYDIESHMMAKFSCDTVVLSAGLMAQNRQDQFVEEAIVILSGEAVIFTGASNSEALQGTRALPEYIFYCPAGMASTIYNSSPSGEPLRYVTFKWSNRASRAMTVNGAMIPASAHRNGNRLSSSLPSSGLDKLHIHSTTRNPGDTFAAHTHRYDTAVVVTEGELTVIDQTMGPGGSFYIRAGELHDSRNEGNVPCHYLVFELHAMAD